MFHKDALFNNKQHTSSKYKIQFELEYLTIKKQLLSFAISQLSPTFVVLKHSTREEIDRPGSVERIFLYLSGNNIVRYTACTPVYML